jgi:isoleucyl-tRNA synthetase
MKDVILDELNIKELVILQDDSDIVNKSAKPNFKILGPKFGKKINPVINSIKELSSKEVALLENGMEVQIVVEGEKASLLSEDVEIVNEQIPGLIVESEGRITVAIDSELTSELIAEGLAREFVNRIQNMRKDAGFEVTDKIHITYSGSEKLVDAVQSFNMYISLETLAEKIELNSKLNGGFKQDWKIGEQYCTIQIGKIST